MVAASVSALPNTTNGECITGKPLEVRQVCGYVMWKKAGAWRSKLRLTSMDASKSRPFEAVLTSDDEGRFTFKHVAKGSYGLRVTPEGMEEIPVPVLLNVRHSQDETVCKNAIALTIDSLPELCVTYELEKH